MPSTVLSPIVCALWNLHKSVVCDHVSPPSSGLNRWKQGMVWYGMVWYGTVRFCRCGMQVRYGWYMYACGLQSNSLCMGWPAWVSLVSVVHVCNPRAEEQPEAVEGEEGAAQHDVMSRYIILFQVETVYVCCVMYDRGVCRGCPLIARSARPS